MDQTADDQKYEPEESDDEDGSPDSRLAHIEHAFCWDYKSIVEIAGHEEIIGEAILDEMRNDPRAFLESE